MEDIVKEGLKQAPIVVIFAIVAFMVLQKFLEHLKCMTAEHTVQMAARDEAFLRVTERSDAVISHNSEVLGETTATMRDLKEVVERAQRQPRETSAA